MTPLFKKLNFKEHQLVLVVQHPPSFAQELKEMGKYTTITNDVKKIVELEFAICFVTTQKQIDQFIKIANKKVKGDVILWFCYPKTSSKKYQCDFNRDTGWASIGALEYEPVRQVAIDEDWSALRFRKVSYIKTITRKESYALTTEAKKRTTKKGI
jgi:hypothetical protein